MKTIRFTVDGKDILFICEARDTRSGFAHDATLIVDGRRLHTSHCYYLNRTWESYAYQTVCVACCSEMIENRMADIKEDYRSDNGIHRVCGKRKAEVKALCDSDSKIAFLRSVKDVLKTKSF